jgi:hypothetical protein
VTDTAFCVRLPDLLATVDGLAEVASGLAAATGRVSGLPPEEAGDLVAALAGVADHWEHGVGTLRRGVTALHDALREVHDAYARHDGQLADRLGGHR